MGDDDVGPHRSVRETTESSTWTRLRSVALRGKHIDTFRVREGQLMKVIAGIFSPRKQKVEA